MLTACPTRSGAGTRRSTQGAPRTTSRAGSPAALALARAIADAVGLDGRGAARRGVGPGALTLLLAPHVAEAVGVDADAGMLEQAARLAQGRGVRNVSWHRLRAEELPAASGRSGS